MVRKGKKKGWEIPAFGKFNTSLFKQDEL